VWTSGLQRRAVWRKPDVSAENTALFFRVSETNLCKKPAESGVQAEWTEVIAGIFSDHLDTFRYSAVC
jgi:hypothetical protein